ncbi:ferritin family protein [Virgibacillus byunsanensis]|uniref:Ferritin family protein n=1 Tax=Virgibacillus byunsanensis TaxID=570945 RepID=A0ABW3LIE2_9BACI
MYYYTYPYPYAFQAYNPGQNVHQTHDDQEFRAKKGQNEQVLQALVDGMEGESEAIDFYTRLAKMAPTNMARDAVEHALEDEKIHLQLFIDLYKNLTGKSPNYKKRKKQFANFKEGIMLAYKDELEAYEQYRDDYLLTSDQEIRDTFFLAMSDEIEHATRFGFVYHTV